MITQNHGNNADTVKSKICRYEYNSCEYIFRCTNININMFSKNVDQWIDRLLYVHLYILRLNVCPYIYTSPKLRRILHEFKIFSKVS